MRPHHHRTLPSMRRDGQTILFKNPLHSIGGTGSDRAPSLASEAASSIVVGDGVTKATPAVTLQGNNGTSALAGVEAAASTLALSIVSARAGNELSARGLSRSSSRGGRGGSTTIVQNRGGGSGGSGSLSPENTGSIVVGSCVTETAATITFEGYNSTSTFASVEATASTLAFGVVGTGTSDKLSAWWLAGSCSWGSRSSSTAVVDNWGSRGSRGLTPQHTGSVVVGNTVTEAASTITLKSDDGTCTLASVESTAPRTTVGIGVARASNELGTGSLTRNEGCIGERCSQSDKSDEKGDPASEHDE